ncbi:MAG: FG-GAP repeat protein [Planctomycetota bacterium]
MDAGSAYAFVRAGSAWSQEAKLIASDAAAEDMFGYDVDLHGGLGLIGAPYDNTGGHTDAGSAYVFTRVA